MIGANFSGKFSLNDFHKAFVQSLFSWGGRTEGRKIVSATQGHEKIPIKEKRKILVQKAGGFLPPSSPNDHAKGTNHYFRIR